MKIADTSGQDVTLTPPRRKTHLYIIAAVVCSIAAFAWSMSDDLDRWASAEKTVSMKRLRIATVEQGNLVRDVSVQGKVVAAIAPRLYSPAEGTITFEVEAGTQVSEGDVIASIDSPELQNRLEQEQGTLQRLTIELERHLIQSKKTALENQKKIDLARVELTAAKREKRRADLAYAQKAISQIDFEVAQDDLENAELVHSHAVQDALLSKESLAFESQTRKLQVNRQSLTLKDIQRQVNDLTIHSPVNGIVGNLDVKQKNKLSKNQSIATVVDLSVFEVEVAIPESYADDLSIGMQAEVKLDGQTLMANLVTISPEVKDNQVVGRIRFEGDSPRGLRQSQRLTTRILLEQVNDVTVVRRGQFLESGSGRVAYVVKDGMAVRQSIETGARSLSSVQILAGLEPGDAIIVSSTELFAGAEQVMIAN